MKRLGWVLFLVLIVYFIFLIRQDIIDNLELKKEKDAVAQSFAREQQTADDLNSRLSRLKSGELTEELARTKLGLVKKGETAYKVISH